MKDFRGIIVAPRGQLLGRLAQLDHLTILMVKYTRQNVEFGHHKKFHFFIRPSQYRFGISWDAVLRGRPKLGHARPKPSQASPKLFSTSPKFSQLLPNSPKSSQLFPNLPQLLLSPSSPAKVCPRSAGVVSNSAGLV